MKDVADLPAESGRVLAKNNPSPILIGDKVRLVPFGPAHLTAGYVGWLNDPVVTVYSEQRHCRHTLNDCVAYYDGMVAVGNYFWAIESKDDPSVHIGNITAYVDRPNLVADLAIMVGANFARGQGLGAEAWCMACDWLLGDGAMRKVTAGTMACNAPMRALMNKSGMIVEAVRSRHFLRNGVEEDMILAARFRDG